MIRVSHLSKRQWDAFDYPFRVMRDGVSWTATIVELDITAFGHTPTEAVTSAEDRRRSLYAELSVSEQALRLPFETDEPELVPASNQLEVAFKRTRSNARVPMRATNGAAGYDVYAAVNITVEAGDSVHVPLGFASAIPDGYYGDLRIRSSLWKAYRLAMIGSGVIDSDYRGEWHFAIINMGTIGYTIKAGDRIGQVLFQKAEQPIIVERDTLSETVRGENGFGSTGK